MFLLCVQSFGGDVVKKPYTPLEISLQSLSAGGMSAACAYQVNHAVNTCTFTPPGWGETIFGSGNNNCFWVDGEDICYHVPSASSNVFDS